MLMRVAAPVVLAGDRGIERSEAIRVCAVKPHMPQLGGQPLPACSHRSRRSDCSLAGLDMAGTGYSQRGSGGALELHHEPDFGRQGGFGSDDLGLLYG